jgi:hypothetical protein
VPRPDLDDQPHTVSPVSWGGPTDGGLGGRVHPQIAWAKLDALARGAQLATEQLWPLPDNSKKNVLRRPLPSTSDRVEHLSISFCWTNHIETDRKAVITDRKRKKGGRN